MIFRPIVIAGLMLASAGCTTAGMQLTHTSHPFAGPPFGPQTEEDYLDTVGIFGRREIDPFFIETELSYKLSQDSGFYGPELVFSGRIGINIWRKDR